MVLGLGSFGLGRMMRGISGWMLGRGLLLRLVGVCWPLWVEIGSSCWDGFWLFVMLDGGFEYRGGRISWMDGAKMRKRGSAGSCDINYIHFKYKKMHSKIHITPGFDS